MLLYPRKEKYRFKDMYSGGFHLYGTLEEYRGYWSRYIYINRYMDAPKPVYWKLYELVKEKDYFVLTTNVDHCLQKAGFDKHRLFYTQGDYGLFQCSKPCQEETYDNEETVRNMVLSQGYRIMDGELVKPEGIEVKRTVPEELVPYCPHCGRPMSMTLRMGKGYSRPNLNNMRKFYLRYPNCQTVSDNLSWSHICELITIDDDLERQFYENECIKERWDVRTLRREKDAALFLRLASSKDKEGILALAQEGITYQTPEDVIKNTYTLDFLNIPQMAMYSESELEQKIIDNLQQFLMELGKGFTFVGRQYPMTISNVTYHCDLVFYHRILKCFVLIDLKINAVKHRDIGQMNMYMGYIATEENMPDDNPPIGIILSKEKDELLVEYATYGMDSNLFISKYELYLPNRDELKRLVDRIIEEDIQK